MSVTEMPIRRLDQPRPTLYALLRKCVPCPRRAAPVGDPCADLERLALSSPHLLPDLGFEPDRTASDAGRTVWRRGAFMVTLHPADGPGGAPRVEVRRTAVEDRR